MTCAEQDSAPLVIAVRWDARQVLPLDLLEELENETHVTVVVQRVARVVVNLFLREFLRCLCVAK